MPQIVLQYCGGSLPSSREIVLEHKRPILLRQQCQQIVPLLSDRSTQPWVTPYSTRVSLILP